MDYLEVKFITNIDIKYQIAPFQGLEENNKFCNNRNITLYGYYKASYIQFQRLPLDGISSTLKQAVY